MGFVILFLARRWVCCRLVLRVRADLGFREVGVLGLEREGIVDGNFHADGTCVWLIGCEITARSLWFRCKDLEIGFLGEVANIVWRKRLYHCAECSWASWVWYGKYVRLMSVQIYEFHANFPAGTSTEILVRKEVLGYEPKNSHFPSQGLSLGLT